MPKIKPPADRYITRMDSNYFYGWRLEVKSKVPGERAFVYFSDKRYGSKEKSKTAAQRHRDQTVADKAVVVVLPSWPAPPLVKE